MRVYSFSFRRIASLCAASFGDRLRWIACIVSFVLAPDRLPNTLLTRSSSWPERSIATMVLSNVAGFGLLAMASTSSISWRMPSAKAGS